MEQMKPIPLPPSNGNLRVLVTCPTCGPDEKHKGNQKAMILGRKRAPTYWCARVCACACMCLSSFDQRIPYSRFPNFDLNKAGQTQEEQRNLKTKDSSGNTQSPHHPLSG